jgi:flavin reductase (DIM6/NTAB) family NADH-FMN oxidoreductase RutF
MDPRSLSLGKSKTHYTNAGIKQCGTFSVNLPSKKMVQETDYCGLVSGRRVDKTKLFSVFYGTLKTAPMIVECPISMECELKKVIDFPKHDVFIGEIVATYVDDTALTDGVVDYSKVQPFFFTMIDHGYWKLGERFAEAWSVGKALKGDN